MNFIQTFYIAPDKDPFRNPFGWVAPEYHLIGWALSCLQLYTIYGRVDLYANSPAARLLIDTLQLPYSEVRITHDKLSLIHPDLWALPKIHTEYSPPIFVAGRVYVQYILSSFTETLNSTNKLLLAACFANNSVLHVFSGLFEKGKALREDYFNDMGLDMENPAIEVEFQKHEVWKQETTKKILYEGVIQNKYLSLQRILIL